MSGLNIPFKNSILKKRDPRKNFYSSLPKKQEHTPAQLKQAYGSQSGYKISGPSKSTDFFAPTCSTRLFQFDPRK
jgi:hypothetical protein